MDLALLELPSYLHLEMEYKIISNKEKAKMRSLYTQSLDWIHSMNQQMSIPGKFIADRLESETLDEVYNELLALLLATQSQSSALLRTTFNNASMYNDNFKRILSTLWPIKEKISSSYKTVDDLTNSQLIIKNNVKTLLKRLSCVMYSKLAIRSFILASENLDSICDEVFDTFNISHEYKYDIHSKKVLGITKIIEAFTKNIKTNLFTVNKFTHCNASVNWILFELIPKRLKHISFLLEKCNYYEGKLRDFMNDDEVGYNDDSGVNTLMEYISTTEHLCNDAMTQNFKSEYSKDTLSGALLDVYESLMVLIKVCAQELFEHLFNLYSNLNSTGVDNITYEASEYLSGLASMIKGYDELSCHYKQNDNELINIFTDKFLKPFFEFVKIESNHKLRSFDEDSETFLKFIDFIGAKLLDPNQSILIRFLDDLSSHCNNDVFKSTCILDVLPPMIFDVIDENYPYIFTVLYPDQFFQNYKSVEKLLTILESSCNKSNTHLLKWRGCIQPFNFYRKFCTSVVCNTYIDDIMSVVNKDLEKKHDIDGISFSFMDKKFYISSTLVVYKQIFNLISHDSLLYHLFPQYLKAMNDIIKYYIEHVDSFITHMHTDNALTFDEKSNKALPYNANLTQKWSSTDNLMQKWPSGISFTYSTYVLHDIVVITNSFKLYPSLRETFPHGLLYYLGNNKDADLGIIVKQIFNIVLEPLTIFIERYKIELSDEVHSKFNDTWDRFLIGDEDDGSYDEMQSMLKFIFECVKMVHDYCNVINQQIKLIEIKLVDYITNSLYISSRCSLQFVQLLTSKCRAAEKGRPVQTSEYIKFLIAPLISFVEFSQGILPEDVLMHIMSMTIGYISDDYFNHIKKLYETVENMNDSLMRTKSIHLNSFSENFLIIDIEEVNKQISQDIQDFYDTCVTRFNITESNCTSLNRLLEYTL